jgi:hypothetical protein
MIGIPGTASSTDSCDATRTSSARTGSPCRRVALRRGLERASYDVRAVGKAIEQ